MTNSKLWEGDYLSYIFVHGLGQNSSNWRETINGLNIVTNIECPNLFDLYIGELNYNNLYRTFSKYCDKYTEPLNICGLSLGGMLALNYAINNPHKVHSLVLIGTQYRIPKKLMKFQNIIFKIMPEEYFRKIGVSKKDVISLTNSMINLNFENDLVKITCPVLVVCGEKDIANVKASKKLKKLLNTSTLKLIQNAGHEVNKDNPKQLGDELNAFFGRIKTVNHTL